MKYYLKLLTLPILFFALFASLFVVWKIANLPPPEELARIVKTWFDTYGLPVVFLSSIVEGVLLVGGYFPGVFVIFLGVILADSILQAAMVVAVVTAGLFIAHSFNYALGRYGWYRLLVRFGLKDAVEMAQARLMKKGPIAILLSYWLPSVGALTDTAAGIIHMPFKKFLLYSLISVTLWDTGAGILVYSFKDVALSISSPGSSGRAVIFAIIAVWATVILVKDFIERKKRLFPPSTGPDRDAPV
ncbi:MAG: VTT domain-containing protein [Patescibacteria group bacterium]